MIIDIDGFISKYVTKRPQSMFLEDFKGHIDELKNQIEGKSTLVIGGAGSIGSSFIKAILQFKPAELVIVDTNENALEIGRAHV